jgi:phage terminase small subunit
MTQKQLRFIDEYLVDLNATQAAIRAGYSKKTAHVIGSENLGKPEIAKAVAERQAARSIKTRMTAEQVLDAIAEIAQADIRGMFGEGGRLLLPEEWDDSTAAAVSGLDVVTVEKGEGAVEYVAKIKRADRLRALDMLARHHALYNDKLNVTVTDGLADRVKRARERAAGK